MDIKGRITQVEFAPNNFFCVRGMVNSTFNKCRTWGEDAGDGFTIAWYWYASTMPPELLVAFNTMIGIIDTELQSRGILPKKWPGVLDNANDDADIFKFKIKKYSLKNPAWASAKDQEHVISITASSEWFTDDKDLEKDVRIRLKEDDLQTLFTALENNL